MYTEDYIYVLREGNIATLSTTAEFFVEFKQVSGLSLLVAEGDEINRGDDFLSVEYHSGIDEITSPLTGKIIKINTDPDFTSDDWFCEIEITDPDELNLLMSDEEYSDYCEEDNGIDEEDTYLFPDDDYE